MVPHNNLAPDFLSLTHHMSQNKMCFLLAKFIKKVNVLSLFLCTQSINYFSSARTTISLTQDQNNNHSILSARVKPNSPDAFNNHMWQEVWDPFQQTDLLHKIDLRSTACIPNLSPATWRVVYENWVDSMHYIILTCTNSCMNTATITARHSTVPIAR